MQIELLCATQTYIIYVLGTSHTLYALYVLHYILLYVRIASIECNIQ